MGSGGDWEKMHVQRRPERGRECGDSVQSLRRMSGEMEAKIGG